MMANMRGLRRYLVLLELRTALALSLSLKLAVIVHLNIKGLLSVLIEELTLVPRVLFGYQL